MAAYSTDNAEHLEHTVLPAYERELAYAHDRGDMETVREVEAEIARLRSHLGLPAVRTQTAKAPHKRTR